MKILGFLVVMLLVLSVGVSAVKRTNQLDIENADALLDSKEIFPSGELYESIVQDIEREDRLERCKSRIARQYPAAAEDKKLSACKRIFAVYDAKTRTREELKERHKLSEAQAERLAKVKEERREKIESMNEERVKKLAELEARNIEKISKLSAERIEKIADLDKDFLEKFGVLSSAKMSELSKMSKEDIEKKLRNVEKKRLKTEIAGRKRGISEEKKKEAENNYRKAKTEYSEYAKKYREQKKEFDDLVKAEREACKEEGDDCEKAKKASLRKAKNFLQSLGKQQLAYIEQMRERVMSSEAFTNGEADEILEGLDESEAKINRALNFLETAETKPEVKEAAKTLLKNWERIRVKVRDSREEIVYREGKKYVARNEALETKMARMLERMEDAEIDTSEYEEQLDEYSDLVLEANEKLVAGREKLREFRESENHEDNLELLEESKELFNEAHILLKEAHALLMDIAKDIYDDHEEEFEDEDDEVEVIDLPDKELPKPPSLEELEVSIE